MSSEVAIKVEHLSKCYHIYDNPRDRLMQMLMRGRKQYFREFWALRDVSFEIRKGETVGIIGRNGSGKSTLLQMICGTLNPTSGSIQTNGRIAALLELGSGFNPEFTGRENVYLNAALLGLSKAEIDARFDDIAAFADIGEFIEQPVKTYSSGMVVRLAFAVAINVEPEILVVDEALAVGDELFQRKCFSRIEAIRAGGATILFVSHSGAQIVELCDYAVLMDAGEKLAMGQPKQIVGRYQKLLYAPADKRQAISEQIRRMNERSAVPISSGSDAIRNNFIEHARESQESFDPSLKPSSTIEYESHGAYIESPTLTTLTGEQVNNLISGRTYRYSYTVRFSKSASNVRFGMNIKTINGIELGGAVTARVPEQGISFVEANSLYVVEFMFIACFNQGTYFTNAGVTGSLDQGEQFLHRLVDAISFRVIPQYDDITAGIVNISPAISSVRKLENNSIFQDGEI